MPRKPRVQGDGMIHHVVVRDNQKQVIFLSDGDRIRYLQLVERYMDRYRFTLLSYCLLDNHVHLLLQQENTPLSTIMQGLQQSYTQFYNRKYATSGHVFQQRFASYPCMEDAYLVSLIAYIHKNPKASGVVQSADDYRWSSHHEIVRPSKKNLVRVEDLLRLLGIGRAQFMAEYHKMLNEVEKKDITHTYMRESDEALEQADQDSAPLNGPFRWKKHSMQDIDAAIRRYEKLSSHTFNIVQYRRLFAVLCARHTAALGKEIAARLDVQPARISQIQREFAEGEWTDWLKTQFYFIEEGLLVT